jgi:GTP-binding protein
MKITSAQFIKSIRGTDPITQDGIPQIAFVGRSNVGKSSLINALVGKKDLVKVGDKPGKTKEVNFFLVNHKYYLVDLPGYGFAAADPKEREKLKKLIAWYLVSSEIRPHLVVLVIDAKVGLTAFDEQMISVLIGEKHPYIVAVNKADKLSRHALQKQFADIAARALSGEVVACSATEKGGVTELFQKVFE